MRVEGKDNYIDNDLCFPGQFGAQQLHPQAVHLPLRGGRGGRGRPRRQSPQQHRAEENWTSEGLDLYSSGLWPAEQSVQVAGILQKISSSQEYRTCYCRAKDLPFISNRRGLEEFYCPKITKRREERRGKNCRKLKNGKKKCREKKTRRGGKGAGWMWKTRDCSSLPRRRDVKRCRREKRRRCIQRQKSQGMAKYEAKMRCQSGGWGEGRPRPMKFNNQEVFKVKLNGLDRCVKLCTLASMPVARNVRRITACSGYL